VIQTYRNRPVRIDAVQWDGTRKSEDEITRWALPRVRGSAGGRHLTVVTPGGNQRANPGDWIVKGPDGRIRIMKAAEFDETYELTTD
jgi:hypothetical protein